MNTPDLLIRPSTPADLPAITAIDGWNVCNGTDTDTFEPEAPDEPEMARRALGFDHAGVIRSAGCKFNRWLDVTIRQESLGLGAATESVDAA